MPLERQRHSEDPMTEFADTSWRNANLRRLITAQAVVGAQMPLHFAVGGLSGHMLAINKCWATLPISMTVFGSMLTALWISPLMQRHGRRAGFLLALGASSLGALICAWALWIGSFPLLLFGSFCIGIYMSAHGFYRFAAAETVAPEKRAKAISLVMAGGLGAAVIGPQLAKLTQDALVVPFVGAYLSILVLNAVGLLALIRLDIPKPEAPEQGQAGRSRWELLTSPGIAVAMICAMVSYALMNLVMTSTPLAVVGCGYGRATSSDIITSHVLGMYAPAFFTGHLIARFGAVQVIAAGLALLAVAGGIALQDTALINFYAALILLGVGWNFGFIGATSLLTSLHTPQERGRVQGINDFLVFGMVTIASVASGGLMNCSGSSAQAGWTAVNLAMIPFLLLAGGALAIYLMRRMRALSLKHNAK